MKHKQELLLIKLGDLVPSPFNVRRYPPKAVAELAALIESQGLLQPLIVTEQAVGTGRQQMIKFGVAAGERRRRALLLLQQQGKLSSAHEVLCELVPAERAIEISLAENSGREPMHPADEFDAFQALVAQGRSVEDIAARFGVAAVTVRRRLKLAALSPKLITLYREKGIQLDQLMALTLSDDHAVQERTWFEAKPWCRSSAAIRQALTEGELQTTGSALVRFVGIEQFEAAGGRVRRDLFDAEEAGWISDFGLLRRLATEKLETLAAPHRGEGWAWVEVRIELDSHGLREFARCNPGLRAATGEELKAMAEFNQREAELDAMTQAMRAAPTWSDLEAEQIDLEESDIAARRAAIVVARQTWTDDERAKAGVIVTVGRDGDAEIIRGLVRHAKARQRVVALKQSGAVRAREVNRSQEAACASSAAPVAPGQQALSAALRKRLAAHKTAALQAVMVDKVSATVAVLTFTLAQQVFGADHGQAQTGLQVAIKQPAFEMQQAADELGGSKAWLQLDAARAAWQARLPASESEWLAWIAALPQEDALQLLAFCTAACMNVKADSADASAAAVHQLVELNMVDWWQPTAAGFLSHVSKAQIMVALKESDPAFVDAATAALPKDALVAKAQLLLNGKGWLPAPLRVVPTQAIEWQ
jgi:ParB family transcriptional regulator, chromosome partitioning protein